MAVGGFGAVVAMSMSLFWSGGLKFVCRVATSERENWNFEVWQFCRQDLIVAGTIEVVNTAASES